MQGSTLGRYQIRESIGAGGMGEVWLAHDPNLQRDVAIKILLQGTIGDERTRVRFRREALALSRLSHPNIAGIYDFDTDNGVDYIVMEHVDGETLDATLSRGKIAPHWSVEIARQMALGLAAAHGKGIVHRDLKPANVKITSDGVVKILDFGLAAFRDPGTQDATVQGVTGSNTMVGTLRYMSPEQLTGERVGPRSDLFSLGIIVHEMLTGEHPFAEPTPQAVAYKIANVDPPRFADLPDLDSGVSAVLRSLLEKSPDKRPTSAASIAQALSHQSDSSDVIVPVSRLRKYSTRSIRVMVALIGLFLLAAYLKGADASFSSGVTTNVRRLTFSGKAQVPNWSPDGSTIAFLDNSEGGGAFVVPVEGGSPRKLETGRPFDVPWGWMPDGSAVVTHSSRVDKAGLDVLKVGLSGEPPEVLVEHGYYSNVSPDGRHIAYRTQDGSHGLWIQNLETGDKRKLVDPGDEGSDVYKPKFSPDGKMISFHRWAGGGGYVGYGTHQLWLIDFDGSNERMIDTGPLKLAGQYAWTPDGNWLLICGHMNGVWGVWQISVMGEKHRRLTTNPEEEMHVSVSPDGSSFAFGRHQDLTRVVVIDNETGKINYPAKVNVATKHPAFSLDGESIYFHVLVNDRWQIWNTRLDGDGTAEPVVLKKGESCFGPVIDADGNILHIRGNVGRVWRFGRLDWSQTLWRTGSDGSKSTAIKSAGEWVERVAPGQFRSQRLAYSASGPDNEESIYVLDKYGVPVTLFEDTDDIWFSCYDWGHDDRTVYIAHADSGANRPAVISAIDIETLERTELLRWAQVTPDSGVAGGFWKMAVSPDGKKLAIIPQGALRTKLLLHDLDKGTTRVIREFTEEEGNPLYVTWSPNGSSLALSLYRSQSDIFVAEPVNVAGGTDSGI